TAPTEEAKATEAAKADEEAETKDEAVSPTETAEPTEKTKTDTVSKDDAVSSDEAVSENDAVSEDEAEEVVAEYNEDGADTVALTISSAEDAERIEKQFDGTSYGSVLFTKSQYPELETDHFEFEVHQITENETTYVFLVLARIKELTPIRNSEITPNGNGKAIYDEIATKTINLTNIGTLKCEIIGPSVFCNTYITEFQVPDQYKIIGTNAFLNCQNLASVTVNDNIYLVDDNAFSGCITLGNIAIDKLQVNKIDIGVFNNCNNLQRVTLPNGINCVSNNAFASTLIETINIPASVKQIGNGAFQNNTRLATLTGCEGVTHYWDNCFMDCTNLAGSDETGKTLPISTKTEVIHAQAFANCTAFSTVNLTDAIKLNTIGNGAFSGCTGLKDLTFPADGKNFTFIGENAFLDCSNLKYSGKKENIIIPDTVKTVGTSAFQGCVELKAITIGKNVENVCSNAFAQTGIKSIYFPPSIEVLGSGVCQGCESLEEFRYDPSWTMWEIPKYAFLGCKKLKSTNGSPIIKIPNQAILIDDDAFNGCESITEFSLPTPTGEDDLFINNRAFCGCKSLKEINFNERTLFEGLIPVLSISITYDANGIGSLSYTVDKITPEKPVSICEGCTSLTSFSINNPNAGIIPPRMFAGCTSLTEFNKFTSGTKHIWYEAFADCDSLKTITIPNQIETIQHDAFNGCDGITSVTINPTLKQIDTGVFANCTNLKEIDFGGTGSKLITIGTQAFYKCPSLESVDIPDDITTIGASAFEGCTSLSKVNFPLTQTSFTGVDPNAFAGCVSLNDIYFPKSLKTVHSSVFSGCTGLTKIHLGAVKSIEADAFAGCDNLIFVYFEGTKGARDELEGDDKFNGGNDALVDAYWKYGWNGQEESTAIAATDVHVTYKNTKTGETVTISNNDTVKMKPDMSIVFTAALTPENATNYKYTRWSTSNPGIAEFIYNDSDSDEDDHSNVTVKALSPGTAQITVLSADGPKMTFNIEVGGMTYDISVKSVSGATISADKAEDVEGGVVTVTCTHVAGYEFDHWDVRDTAGKEVPVADPTVEEKTTFRMPADDVIVSVSLNLTPLALSPAKSKNGGLNLSNADNLHVGDKVTATATPNEGYVFSGIKIESENGKSVVINYDSSRNDNTVEFEIPAIVEGGSLTITALFKPVHAGLWADFHDGSGNKVYKASYTGKAVKPVPDVYYNGKKLRYKKDYTLSYKNNKKVFDATGVTPETAKMLKAPYILIKGKGQYKGKKIVPFSIAPLNIANAEAPDAAFANGKAKFTPVIMMNGAKLKAGKDFIIKEASGNAIIDAKRKKATFATNGTFLVTLEGIGSCTGTATCCVTVGSGESLSKAKVRVAPANYTGTDASLNESIVVNVTGAANAVLNKANGFTNNGVRAVFVNATKIGKGTVYILPAEGNTSYCGSKKATFKIVRSSVYDLKEASVNITESGSYDANGKYFKAPYSKGGATPAVSVSFKGVQLTEGVDYRVSYANNEVTVPTDTSITGANLPQIIITGIGDYKGEQHIPFSIIRRRSNAGAKTVIVSTTDSIFAVGKTPVGKITLYDGSNGKLLNAGVDYDEAKTVYSIGTTNYEGADAFKAAPVNVGTQVKVTVTLKGMYSGVATGNFSITDKAHKIKSAKFTGAKKTYTGEAITPEAGDFTVKASNGAVLKPGTDYIVESCTKNVNKGSGKAVIRGIGEYGGTKTVKFKIVAADISIAEMIKNAYNKFAETFRANSEEN
ncbi:MAG: leucine-rich repeat protein, partial [Lachnospiraceae bacterium]|nr:leucine-rich repeat protein [Lachnospiraceae bacterium]